MGPHGKIFPVTCEGTDVSKALARVQFANKRWLAVVCVRGEDIKHWHFVILQNGVELLSCGNKDAAAVTVIPVSSLICIVAKGAASRMVAPGL